MVEKVKKLPKLFQYFKDEDQFAGGVAFCARMPGLELTLRTCEGAGKETVIVGNNASLFGPGSIRTKISGSWHRYALTQLFLMTGLWLLRLTGLD